MKQMIVLAAVFLTLFAASAGGSWYYVQKFQEEEKAKKLLAEKELEQKDNTELPEVEKFERTPELPFPLPRPKDMDSETLLRLADTLRKREETIRENEQRIKQEQSRLQFILQDMDQERTELNAIHDKIAAKISEAENILKEIKQDHQDFSEAKTKLSEIENARTPVADEASSISSLVELYKEMPSETAARYLREVCDSGKISLAAKVLNHMEKSAATDILVAMDDPVLVGQIVQEMLANPVKVAATKSGGRKR